MNSRRTCLSLRVGLAAVLALGAVGVLTGPAFAQVDEITIDPDGSIGQPRGTIVMVSGTLTCTNPFPGIAYASMIVALQQDQGHRFSPVLRHSFPVNCTGQPQDWIETYDQVPGFLRPGPVTVSVVVTPCCSGPDFRLETAARVHLHPE